MDDVGQRTAQELAVGFLIDVKGIRGHAFQSPLSYCALRTKSQEICRGELAGGFRSKAVV
jgi:hypothetical protein